MSKPTIVFVTGVWHDPACFDSTRALLSERGFPSEALHHPSVGSKLADKILADDVNNVREKLITLADEGKEIIVICHSYGGMVAGCAVEDLGFTDRAKQGKSGGVTMLVYMCALVAKKGLSMLEMLGGKMLPWLEIGEDNFVRPENPENYLYHDVSPDEQAKWVSKLEPTSGLIYRDPCTYEPWNHMPCMYLYCKEDRALVPEAQDVMIQNMKETGDVTVFHCDGSHSPFLSMPDKVVECLELAAKLGTEKIGKTIA